MLACGERARGSRQPRRPLFGKEPLVQSVECCGRERTEPRFHRCASPARLEERDHITQFLFRRVGLPEGADQVLALCFADQLQGLVDERGALAGADVGAEGFAGDLRFGKSSSKSSRN